MSSKVTVKCERCGQSKQLFPCRLRQGRGRFCSVRCRDQALGKELAAKARSKITQEGKSRSLKKFRELIKWQKAQEHNHPSWKGHDVTYGRLHHWMRDKWGTPSRCDVCGTDDRSKTYDWACLNGRYIRDRSEFKRMCRSCHNKHDDRIKNITNAKLMTYHKLFSV